MKSFNCLPISKSCELVCVPLWTVMIYIIHLPREWLFSLPRTNEQNADLLLTGSTVNGWSPGLSTCNDLYKYFSVCLFACLFVCMCFPISFACNKLKFCMWFCGYSRMLPRLTHFQNLSHIYSKHSV